MLLSPTEFEYLRTVVHQGSAIVLDSGKAYLAEARLAPLARSEGLPSIDHLVARLRAGQCQALRQKVIEAMTTNETSFFRDVHPFDTLRDFIVPELLERRAGERRLTVWCGACSTGQEPYSVAMLLREHFPALASWRVRILASDLAESVLDRARAGRFSQLEVTRGLPPKLLTKYFNKDGAEWQLRAEIREMVEFFPVNLVEAWPKLPQPDTVLLRNVLIYFDAPTKKLILGKIRKLLAPDGYLFLGGAETTHGLDDNYQRVQLGRTPCYRPTSA